MIRDGEVAAHATRQFHGETPSPVTNSSRFLESAPEVSLERLGTTRSQRDGKRLGDFRTETVEAPITHRSGTTAEEMHRRSIPSTLSIASSN
jgi:hypothetical protein